MCRLRPLSPLSGTGSNSPRPPGITGPRLSPPTPMSRSTSVPQRPAPQAAATSTPPRSPTSRLRRAASTHHSAVSCSGMPPRPTVRPDFPFTARTACAHPPLLRIRSQRPVRPEHQERDPPEWQRGHDLHSRDGIHDICTHDDALRVHALDCDDDCSVHDSSGADEHAIRGQLRRSGLVGRERRVQRR